MFRDFNTNNRVRVLEFHIECNSIGVARFLERTYINPQTELQKFFPSVDATRCTVTNLMQIKYGRSLTEKCAQPNKMLLTAIADDVGIHVIRLGNKNPRNTVYTISSFKVCPELPLRG